MQVEAQQEQQKIAPLLQPLAADAPFLTEDRARALAVGVVLYIFFSALDYFCLERSVPYAALLRSSVAALLLFALWRYARDVRRQEVFDRLQCLLSITAALTIEYASALAPASLHELYLVGLLLSWVFTALLMQLSLRWMWPMMAFAFLLHNFVGILHEQPLRQAFLDDACMIVGASMIAYAAYLMARTQTLMRQEMQRAHRHFIQLQEVNARLEELSTRDPLTNLENRRSFEDRYDAEWRRCFRARQMLGVMVIDVDHFKQYNDSCGHIAGDQCLRRVADVIACAARRPGDIVARFGGEEFVVVWPQARLDDFLQEAERLCAAVRDQAIVHPAAPGGRVTVSIGIACHVPDTEIGPRRLFESADAALYRAKHQGRDRVEFEEIGDSDSDALFVRQCVIG